jgi:glycosyltransferase involved in cell wall biosynthesis
MDAMITDERTMMVAAQAVQDVADRSGLPASIAVTVVIPCRNEARNIESCLRGVLAFESPPGGFEVVVADGMSDDGTRAIIARLAAKDPRLRMVDNAKRTTPCGLNTAIRCARGEIIARVDAHTVYAPDYLCQCVEVMRETGADDVGGPALTLATSYIQRAVAAAYHSRFAVGNSPFHRAAYEGPADTTVYGCYTKARLLDLGLFDEELVRNQDDELNLRLLRARGRIWQSPRIRSWYRPRGSLVDLFRQYGQYGYWKVRVIQKHRTPASWRHVVPGTFAALLLLAAILSLCVPHAWVGLALLVGVYLLGAGAAAFITAASAGWELLPVLPLVFACYHLGYGFGFLAGVWDFVLLRRASGRFVALTRR